jgi:hypothetical protein
MELSQRQTPTLRAWKSATVCSVWILIFSIWTFVWTVHVAPGQPDESHIYREENGLTVGYLSEGQEMVRSIAEYAAVVSLLSLLVSGSIHSLFKKRAEREALRQLLANGSNSTSALRRHNS